MRKWWRILRGSRGNASSKKLANHSTRYALIIGFLHVKVFIHFLEFLIEYILKFEMDKIPKWVRIFLLGVAVLYLIWVLLFKDPNPRTDFPFFRP